jgi:hypothetical protein
VHFLSSTSRAGATKHTFAEKGRPLYTIRSAYLVAFVAACSFEHGVAPTDDSIAVDASADAHTAQPLACPAGYAPIHGIGMYRPVESTPRTWQAAAADCNDDDDAGGPYAGHTHLVVLANETERLTITGSSTPISGNTWIGLSDVAVEGTYVWVTSEPTGGYPAVGQKPPWDTDDPDDNGGAEDCVRFKNGYVLEDKPCSDVQSYVCECDAFAPN